MQFDLFYTFNVNIILRKCKVNVRDYILIVVTNIIHLINSMMYLLVNNYREYQCQHISIKINYKLYKSKTSINIQ